MQFDLISREIQKYFLSSIMRSNQLSVLTFIYILVFGYVDSAIRELECSSATSHTIGYHDQKEISCIIVHKSIQEGTKLRFMDANQKEYNVLEFFASEIHVFPYEIFEQFYKLRKVRASGSQIRMIIDGSFKGASMLISLDLSRNKLKEIGHKTFFGCKKLNELDLNQNQIEKIHSLAFKDMEELESLNLGQNLIESIDIELFASLKDLKKLFLYGNRLNQMHPRSLLHNAQLQILDLEQNLLEEVEMEIYFKKMHLLNMDKNHMKNLKIRALNSETNIVALKASHNNLTHISLDLRLKINILFLNNNLLETLPLVGSTLQILHLRHNPITKITSTDMQHWKELTYLDLGNSKISFDSKIFLPLNQLKVLYLDEIGMENIQIEWFQGLNELEILNLQGNNFSTLDYQKIIHILPSLTHLFIGQNLFSCEFLTEMMNFFKNTRIEIPVEHMLSKNFSTSHSYVNGIKCQYSAFISEQSTMPLLQETTSSTPSTNSKSLDLRTINDLNDFSYQTDYSTKNQDILIVKTDSHHNISKVYLLYVIATVTALFSVLIYGFVKFFHMAQQECNKSGQPKDFSDTISQNRIVFSSKIDLIEEKNEIQV